MNHDKALTILGLTPEFDYNVLVKAYKSKVNEQNKSNNDDSIISPEINEAFMVLRGILLNTEDTIDEEVAKRPNALEERKKDISDLIEVQTSIFGVEYFIFCPKSTEYMTKELKKLSDKFKESINKSRNFREIDNIQFNFKREFSATCKNFVKLAFSEWYKKQGNTVRKEDIEKHVLNEFDKLWPKLETFYDVYVELSNILAEIEKLITIKYIKIDELVSKQLNAYQKEISTRPNYNELSKELESLKQSKRDSLFNELHGGYLFSRDEQINKHITIAVNQLMSEANQLLATYAARKEMQKRKDEQRSPENMNIQFTQYTNVYARQYADAIQNRNILEVERLTEYVHRLVIAVRNISQNNQLMNQNVSRLLSSVNFFDMQSLDVIVNYIEQTIAEEQKRSATVNATPQIVERPTNKTEEPKTKEDIASAVFTTVNTQNSIDQMIANMTSMKK